MDYLAYSEDLRTVLTTSLASDYEKYVMYTDVVDPLLQMPQVYHKEIRGISLYSDNIEVPHGDTLLPLEEAGNQLRFADQGETTLMRWEVAKEGARHIVAFRKFYDSNGVIAVLSMKLDYQAALEPFIGLIKENMGGLILDSDGNVVYADHAIDTVYKPKEPESLDYIKKNYTYSIREMYGTGWKFCMYCPTKVISKSAFVLMLRNIPVVIGCIILLAVIGYFSSRRMVSRLELLTENMNQIHLGLRKVTVSSDAGEDEISKVTLALSTYYRTSLNKGETMTTIENELQNIRAYLRIQSVMHDGNFQVVEDVDMNVGEVQIPKLILQPLIENAIDHGLDISDKEDHIFWISVRQELAAEDGGEEIIFEVRDNGIGMDEEKVESLLTYSSNGYGLRNVYERIKVLYGDRGDAKISSEPGSGTTVRIIIPKETGAKRT